MRATTASEAEASATLLLTEVEAEIAYSRRLRGRNTLAQSHAVARNRLAGVRVQFVYLPYLREIDQRPDRRPRRNVQHRFINRQIANLDASLTAVTSRLTAAGPPRPPAAGQ